MLRSLTTWLYDEDPLALVAFEAPLEALKRTTSASPSYFESLIDRYFLHNVHRTSLLLRPDPDLAEKLDRTEKERLLQAHSSMTPSALQKVATDSAALKAIQETPDPPQALALIPSLSFRISSA